MLQPVGVLAIAAICRAPAWLHISGIPWIRTKRTQSRCGMKSTCAHFHIIRLQNRASLIAPVVMELKDDLLEAERLLVVQGGSFLRQ